MSFINVPFIVTSSWSIVLFAPFVNVAPVSIVVFPSSPFIPFSNTDSEPSPVIINVPLFSISVPVLFPLNVTEDNVIVPSFVITASPVLFVNATFVMFAVPEDSSTFSTVIAFSNPDISAKSSIVNVYELVLIPSTPVVLVNTLLFPCIVRSSFKKLFITPSGCSIQAVT